MASEIFALLRCVRTADRHADGALIGFTEEDEAREELGHPWVKRRRFLVAVLLLTMTFFVSLAYSLVGSFFPIEKIGSSSKVLPLKIVIKLLSHLGFTMIQISDVVVYGSLAFQNTALGVYLVREIGVTLVEVGIDFAVVSVFYVLGTIVAGQLSDKYGSRIFIITGLFICGASLVIIGLNTLSPIPRRWTIIIALVLLGWGTSFADVPTYSDLLQQAQTLYAKENQESLTAAVSGITAFSQAFGSFLGVLLSGILTYITDFPTGNLMYGEAIIMHAFLVLGVSLIDYVLLKQRPHQY